MKTTINKTPSRPRRRSGVTLLEMLIVTMMLMAIAVAHVRAITHLRNVQAVAKDREELVRDAHNLVENLRIGELVLPGDGEEIAMELDSGSFVISSEEIETANGDTLRSHLVHGEFECPEGPIEINLPVLLRSEKGDES